MITDLLERQNQAEELLRLIVGNELAHDYNLSIESAAKDVPAWLINNHDERLKKLVVAARFLTT
jgi:hypothetical protein